MELLDGFNKYQNSRALVSNTCRRKAHIVLYPLVFLRANSLNFTQILTQEMAVNFRETRVDVFCDQIYIGMTVSEIKETRV